MSPKPPSPVENRNSWRAYTGRLAWPTGLLALGVLVSQALAVWAWGTGVVGTGAAFAWVALNAYVAFTPMHEATHGNVGGTTRQGGVDPWVGHAMAAFFAAPYPAFRLVHLRHHGATNDPDRDPDHWVAGSNPVVVALRCLTIIGAYYAYILRKLDYTNPQHRRLRVQAVFGVLGYICVALGLGLWVGFEPVLWLWLLPGQLAAGVLAFCFDWLPHHPHSARGRYVDTRVIDVPALSVPMLWQNYHLMHHLYPRVPFYRYRTVFCEQRADLAQQGAPVWPPLTPAGRKGAAP